MADNVKRSQVRKFRKGRDLAGPAGLTSTTTPAGIARVDKDVVRFVCQRRNCRAVHHYKPEKCQSCGYWRVIAWVLDLKDYPDYGKSDRMFNRLIQCDEQCSARGADN